MLGFLSRRRREPRRTDAPVAGRPRNAALPADLMRKVRRIEIATNRLVDQGVAGDYHSVFKGLGMEFAEVRPYQPGDDVRTIDWNVTARMGMPFVKKYVEERDLTIFLVVDVSGSLSFGSRAILKRELAAEIAALLSFAALRNQDRVGAALVSDRLELFLEPRRRRTHVLRLVREILDRPSAGGTDLERGLQAVLATLKRRSILFVISDFLGSPCTRALKAAASRHDLIVVEIVDPRDQELPAVRKQFDADGATVVRMSPAEFARHLRHGDEGNPRLTADMLDQLLQHQKPMTAAYHLRMHRQRVHALTHAIVKIVEVAFPDFINRRRR